MLKIIRMDGTSFKTGEPKHMERQTYDITGDIESEFCGFPFENEEKRRKLVEFVSQVRSQVELCHKTNFCMKMPYDSEVRCGVNNGIALIYKCGPNLKSPCLYMRMENIITGKPNKKGLIVKCLAPAINNA